MKSVLILIAVLILVLAGLFAWTRIQVQEIILAHPPNGEFAALSGGRMHYTNGEIFRLCGFPNHR